MGYPWLIWLPHFHTTIAVDAIGGYEWNPTILASHNSHIGTIHHLLHISFFGQNEGSSYYSWGTLISGFAPYWEYTRINVACLNNLAKLLPKFCKVVAVFVPGLVQVNYIFALKPWLRATRDTLAIGYLRNLTPFTNSVHCLVRHAHTWQTTPLL